MTKGKQILLIGGILLTASANAQAYIDPGTTVTIIGGSVWPFIVMIGVAISGFFVKFFWMPIKGTVSKTASIFQKK